MFRFIWELVGLLLFFAAVRSVLTWMLKLFVGQVRGTPAQPQQTARGPEPMRSGGDLYKDPVCGTFVLASRWSTMKGHDTVYFCSAECRDRYLVTSHS